MTTDWFPWVRRNFRKWRKSDQVKFYNETKKIIEILEKELKLN